MKREKLLQLAHIIAGVITLIYGFDSFEAGNFSTASSYLSLAIIFMIVAGSHTWMAQKLMKADVAFFLLESTTIFYSGWLYKLKGHSYLFYTMVFAGTLYLILAIISLFAREKTKHRSGKRTRKRRKRSSLFDDQGSDHRDKNLQ